MRFPSTTASGIASNWTPPRRSRTRSAQWITISRRSTFACSATRALTGDIEVPKERDEATMNRGIPVTYVPARNTIFLSFALAWAEVLEANDIFIGVNALDYSGYPDCRPEFIEAFERMSNLATKAGVEEPNTDPCADSADSALQSRYRSSRPGTEATLRTHA